MRERLVTPADPPITLDEAKAHCRIESDHDDAVLQALIAAATARAETETGRTFGEQTWEALFDGFPSGPIVLGHAPITEVVSIAYTGEDGTSATVDPDGYEIAQASNCGLVLKLADWPATASGANAVVVRYVAGAPWPADVRQAVLLMIGHWNEYRETASERGAAEIPFGASTILGMHWRPFV